MMYNFTQCVAAYQILPLGTWALVANGTFFALAIHSRNHELLLPLILFPIFLPTLLDMVQATGKHSHWRERSLALDQDAHWLRHHLHRGQPANYSRLYSTPNSELQINP